MRHLQRSVLASDPDHAAGRAPSFGVACSNVVGQDASGTRACTVGDARLPSGRPGTNWGSREGSIEGHVLIVARRAMVQRGRRHDARRRAPRASWGRNCGAAHHWGGDDVGRKAVGVPEVSTEQQATSVVLLGSVLVASVCRAAALPVGTRHVRRGGSWACTLSMELTTSK